MKGKGPTQILPLGHKQRRPPSRFNNTLKRRIRNSHTDISLPVRCGAVVEDVADGI